MESLGRLLRPQTIAAVGGKWAAEAFRQCRMLGFGGELLRVHPDSEYQNVGDLPSPPDAAFVAVNRRATIDSVELLSQMGGGGAVCFASGFDEDEEGEGLQSQLSQAAGAMPFLGPNCYGFINYFDGAALWPDQHGGERIARGVAVISQSGNIGINITMQKRGLPLGFVLTVGNQAKVGFSHLIEELIKDNRITSIGLIMEAVDDAAAFDKAARSALERKIPVVALKIGGSEVGARIAKTHTASLAGDDDSYRAFFRRLGIARVESLPQLIESLKLLHYHGAFGGRRIVSMSCSGGEAAMFADAISQRRIAAHLFSESDRIRIGKTLGSKIARAENPLDYHTFIWGDRRKLTAAYSAVRQSNPDACALILDFPRADKCDDSNWRICLESFADSNGDCKMIAIATLPECLPEDIIKFAADKGIAALAGLPEAIAAMEAAADIGESQRSQIPAPILAIKKINSDGERIADEFESKQILKAAGIEIPHGRLAKNSQDAIKAAEDIGYPVAVKGIGIAHKTEADAVKLNCRNAKEVAAAINQIACDSFLIEEMISGGAEILLGARCNSLGVIFVVGAGGTLAELISDAFSLMLPSTPSQIKDALMSLKCAPLLGGFRGRKSINLEKAAAEIHKVALLVESLADDILEMDINPLILRPHSAIAADALFVFRKKGAEK